MRGRRRLWAAAAALVGAAVGAALLLGGSPPSAQPAPVAAPWEFTAAGWPAALGGDEPMTAKRLEELSAWTDSGLRAGEHEALAALASRVALADLGGSGRDAFPGYWPPLSGHTATAPKAPCRNVRVLGTSPAALPVAYGSADSRYAKVLVVYSGACADAHGASTTYTTAAPGVTYVYARSGPRAGTWAPQRSWLLPAPKESSTPQSAVEPATWDLKELTACGADDEVRRDRIIVVDAFTAMCLDARKSGVALVVTDAYRTRGEQAALFQEAVRDYGSVAEARRWVAYADDEVCTSRHCSGVALNVRPTTVAMGWLTATVGCRTATPDGAQVVAVTGGRGCPTGATPVPRMARYGFAAPISSSPGSLEFTLPIAAAGADATAGALSAADCAPSGVPVPNMVASIFRCRLGREGVVGPAQDVVVAEALVISRCESGWNATARAYAGRFVTAANPADGRRYTHAGVFMIEQGLADAGWLPGGYGAVTDPAANIHAAASLWLATRGWEQFGCAVGTRGFESGPVLPQHGGPALPAWARAY